MCTQGETWCYPAVYTGRGAQTSYTVLKIPAKSSLVQPARLHGFLNSVDRVHTEGRIEPVQWKEFSKMQKDWLQQCEGQMESLVDWLKLWHMCYNQMTQLFQNLSHDYFT
jgi:hypothetical protein